MIIFGVESKLEKDQIKRDKLLEDRIRVEDDLRSTQVDHQAALRNHKNAQIEHDKDLKRLAHKEEVLKVLKFYPSERLE